MQPTRPPNRGIVTALLLLLVATAFAGCLGGGQGPTSVATDGPAPPAGASIFSGPDEEGNGTADGLPPDGNVSDADAEDGPDPFAGSNPNIFAPEPHVRAVPLATPGNYRIDMATTGKGEVASWLLDFGDGSQTLEGTGNPPRSAEHEYTKHGEYTVLFLIRGPNNDQRSAGATFTYAPAVVGPPPEIGPRITVDAPNGTAPHQPTFTLHRPDARSPAVAWDIDLGNGQTDGGWGAPHGNITGTYPKVGMYTAKLVVQLLDGRTMSATRTVTVFPNSEARIWTGATEARLVTLHDAYGTPLAHIPLPQQTTCTGTCPTVIDLDAAGTNVTILAYQAGKGGILRIHDADNGSLRHTLKIPGNPHAIDIAPDGAYWVTYADNDTALRIDNRTFAGTAYTGDGTPTTRTSVHFLAGRDTLIVRHGPITRLSLVTAEHSVEPSDLLPRADPDDPPTFDDITDLLDYVPTPSAPGPSNPKPPTDDPRNTRLVPRNLALHEPLADLAFHPTAQTVMALGAETGRVYTLLPSQTTLTLVATNLPESAEGRMPKHLDCADIVERCYALYGPTRQGQATETLQAGPTVTSHDAGIVIAIHPDDARTLSQWVIPQHQDVRMHLIDEGSVTVVTTHQLTGNTTLHRLPNGNLSRNQSTPIPALNDTRTPQDANRAPWFQGEHPRMPGTHHIIDPHTGLWAILERHTGNIPLRGHLPVSHSVDHHVIIHGAPLDPPWLINE